MGLQILSCLTGGQAAQQPTQSQQPGGPGAAGPQGPAGPAGQSGPGGPGAHSQRDAYSQGYQDGKRDGREMESDRCSKNENGGQCDGEKRGHGNDGHGNGMAGKVNKLSDDIQDHGIQSKDVKRDIKDLTHSLNNNGSENSRAGHDATQNGLSGGSHGSGGGSDIGHVLDQLMQAFKGGGGASGSNATHIEGNAHFSADVS